MIKILYIIPANIDAFGELKYSSFIQNEINSIDQNISNIEVKKHFLVNRYNPLSIYKSIKNLKKEIKLFKPNIIHAEVGSITSFIAAISKGKIPLVVTFGGSDVLGNIGENSYWKFRSIIAKLMSKYSFNRANEVICVSKNLKKALSKKENNKISIIPRGIDTAFFQPTDFEKARQVSGWPIDDKVILFNHSNASAKVKNLPLAEESIKILNKDLNYKARLEILRNLSKDEVLTRMNAANLLLVTSFHEGSPNVVKEAMACNLPIISVDVGDVKERIGECNISQITTFNPNQIAEALKEILIKNKRSNGIIIIGKDKLSNIDTSKKIFNVYNKCILKGV